MDPRHWEQIERIYHAAAEKEAEARSTYLEQACNGDQALRKEVESLLAQEAVCADFMESSALDNLHGQVSSLLKPLLPGDKLGHYEILALLAEGGMGEVYRARDTRLNRTVAIKVLPAAYANDAQYMARFEREARVLASLNHPNVAAIYGIEQGAIVMEMVEGEDLQGPLPAAEVIPIAHQIALALEAAHERGIIHRDLKPSNIRLTPEGVVKLLDFGIARASEVSQASSSTSSPFPAAATGEGIILGTAAYMSPEQARGKVVDKRTDIWAFGVVVFELLTGDKLYGGETASDSIAAVITRDPEWNALPKDTPPHLIRLLKRCLSKDPKLRLRDIGEARILLNEPAEEAPPALARTPARGGVFVPWAIAGICMTIAIALGGLLWRATHSVGQPLLRFHADLGPEAVAGNRITAALSPDGMRLVYTVRRGQNQLLAIREMGQSGAIVLPGTENASDPFFSADGQWIGFAASGSLKKVSIQGGAPVTLCDVEVARGGWWGDDGTIVFSSATAGLARVPANGGVPHFITRPSDKGESTHRYPQLLPGGDAVLFTGLASNGRFDDANIEVLFLKTGETRVVQRGGYFGRFLPSGHLIFVHRGSLFAVPFDLSRYSTRGIPVPVVEDIAANPNAGGGELDFSATGTLVYLSGKASAGEGAAYWLDADGKKEPLVSAPNLASPRFSPDGKRLAFSSGGISVYNLASAAVTPITKDRNENHQYPVWTPDGSHVVFSAIDGIWWIRSDGSGEAQFLYRPKNGNAIPWSFSPDGRHLAFSQPGAAGSDLWTLPVDTSDPDHPKAGIPELFLAKDGNHVEPAFSPDGKWLAYSSTERGVFHVFVRPFPESAQRGGQAQISTGQGRVPVWSRAAKEIFYVSGDDHIMVVPYAISGNSLIPGKARPWTGGLLANTGATSPYDLAPDGKRFAVLPAPEGSTGQQKGNLHLTFLLNFFDELKRRVPR
ncbi:MAG TPA: protein kinase [Bryobacteraceae bacterium]|nr:protein kinase [Bryobacteraceae bacterium]